MLARRFRAPSSVALFVSLAAPLAATPQCELLTVEESAPAFQDLFGWSVSIEGDRAAIGAIQTDVNCPTGVDCNAGSVTVVENIGGATTTQVLFASDGATMDQFGQHVSLSGDTLAVGAHFAGAGKVYMFERQGGTWIETQILTSSDGQILFHFGHSLELEGDRLLVGSMLDDHAGPQSGSAYVFEREGGVWVERSKLTASDAAAQERFGRATDLSGDTAIVGAHLDSTLAPASGAVHVYEFDDGGTPADPSDDAWPEVARLAPSASSMNGSFGLAVEVTGDTAFVGAPGELDPSGANTGAVYVYERSVDPMGAPVWTEIDRFIAPGTEAGDGFGESLASNEWRLLVGAPGDDDGGSNAGAAYSYERDPSGAWVLTAKLVPDAAGDVDLAGREMTLALAGDLALVGSPARTTSETQAGAATVFDLAGCLGTPDCVPVPNSTGAGGVLRGRGSLLAAANDLTIEASALPPFVFCLFLASRDPGFVPNLAGGPGTLCIGGQFGRYNTFVQSTGATGTATLPVDVTAIPETNVLTPAVAGDAVWFQLYHRDTIPMSAVQANLTESLRVDFR
ncbi:MAG: hypothetical protein AAFP22_13930 [Planctomycetota bacterium]